MGPHGTVHKTLYEHRNQPVFMNRIVRNTIREESYVLGISVTITLALLEFQ